MLLAQDFVRKLRANNAPGLLYMFGIYVVVTFHVKSGRDFFAEGVFLWAMCKKHELPVSPGVNHELSHTPPKFKYGMEEDVKIVSSLTRVFIPRFHTRGLLVSWGSYDA